MEAPSGTRHPSVGWVDHSVKGLLHPRNSLGCLGACLGHLHVAIKGIQFETGNHRDSVLSEPTVINTQRGGVGKVLSLSATDVPWAGKQACIRHLLETCA